MSGPGQGRFQRKVVKANLKRVGNQKFGQLRVSLSLSSYMYKLYQGKSLLVKSMAQVKSSFKEKL